MANNTDSVVMEWLATPTYAAMEWVDVYWWPVWYGLIFVGCLLSMAPLKTHHDQIFIEIVFVWIRKLILYVSVALVVVPFILLFAYDSVMHQQMTSSESIQAFVHWFVSLAKQQWIGAFGAAALGFALRFIYKRYAVPIWSKILKTVRNNQTSDAPTDIRDEAGRFQAKDFLPRKHYKKGSILIGLDEDSKPIRVPSDTWYETNMQVIGPTRYGKGVVLGCLMDQAIKNGDALFYIDPKRDRFAPHIMHQACLEAGRKFYYVTLHDDGIGKWAPFAGGTKRDALARLETAFGLELTGDPGTDYYKTQEGKELQRAFDKTRNIRGLANLMEETDANRINAELQRWSAIESLCPKNGGGFSIEKALKENAVVYIQGHLDDAVVKNATKVFISELIQEARRLDAERTSHLTTVIDEVSFLTSKILAQSMATAVGFKVNFVLAYQSQNDLLNLDDKTINPRYIHNSINVNSQLKAIYGGADFDTAEAAAKLSGTISKDITKMERTNISGVGGETWDNQRFVGGAEEYYINTNMILTLPPRVCVFVQPNKLMTVCFTSFVPVKNPEDLKEFIAKKAPAPTAVSLAKQEGEAKNKPPESSAESASSSVTESDPKLPDNNPSPSEPDESNTPTMIPTGFIEDNDPQRSEKSDQGNGPESTEESRADDKETEQQESEKKRKNKERRERQKKKKQELKNIKDDEAEGQERANDREKKEPPFGVKPKGSSVEPFAALDLKSDAESIQALDDLDLD